MHFLKFDGTLVGGLKQLETSRNSRNINVLFSLKSTEKLAN